MLHLQLTHHQHRLLKKFLLHLLAKVANGVLDRIRGKIGY